MELKQGIREVIYIEAIKSQYEYKSQKQLKVCAYCRVSTESEEQASSFENQKKYYRDKINENPNWRLVDIFGEEVSGTKAENRPEFLKMIKQCRQGKIDLIITKSLSRFSRNTVDCLNYIRELKALGIAIIFEKENINSLEINGEVIITILSSLAQEESNSLSGNVKKGLQMKMQMGIVNFIKIYGYKLDAEKMPYVIPCQAEIVERIYNEYLTGKSIALIRTMLQNENVKPPNGDKWCSATIQRILESEKYCGDILMQKTRVLDPISKVVVKNDGILPKVLIRNNHIPIVSRDVYEQVQLEHARRSSRRKISKSAKTEQGKFSSKYALTDILICGECKTPYKRTTWARGVNKKIVWRCLSRLENGDKFCTESSTINEESLHIAIMTAINTTRKSRQMLLPYIMKHLKSTFENDETGGEEIGKIENQMAELKNTTMAIIKTADKTTTDYLTQLTQINSEMNVLQVALDEMKKRISYKNTIETKLHQVSQILEGMTEDITEYDDTLVRQSIDVIKVIDENLIHIIFKDGFECNQTVINTSINTIKIA